MRNGLTYIVRDLRKLVNDTNSELWEDARIIEVLDQCRYDFWRLPAILLRKIGDTYYIAFSVSNIEGKESGDFYFRLYDNRDQSLNDDQIVHADYRNGVFAVKTFPVFLDCKSYDINLAASMLWQEKAGYLQDSFDFDADGAGFKRSQEVKHCLDLAEMYRKKSLPRFSVLDRSDVYA